MHVWGLCYIFVAASVATDYSHTAGPMATNFYLDNRTTGRNENAVRLSVNINGARFVTNSGVMIYARSWNPDNQAARSRRSLDPVNAKGYSAARVNAELAKIAAYWQRIEATATETPTAAELREMWATFKGKKTAPRKSAALELLERYARTEGRAWSEGTRTKWGTFAGLFKESGCFSSVEDLADPDKAARFVEYLRTDRGQKDTTAAKYYAILCQVIRYGERLRLFAPGTAEDMRAAERFTKISQPVIYLDRSELLRFLAFDCRKVAGRTYEFDGHRHQLNPETLERVRALFCFCALTSLRISDGQALTWGAVCGDVLTVTTQKTADRLQISLNDKARRILEERRAAQGGSPENSARVFDPVGVVTINDYLKVLGYLCGVNAPITRTYIRGGQRVTETRPKYSYLSSHAARRTFIVTALSLGIAPAVVMKFTGHSNFAAMRPYIDITETAQAEAMAKFNEL